MHPTDKTLNRRGFIKSTTLVATGITSFGILPQFGYGHRLPVDNDISIIGPKAGFSPQIGTLVSMMTWMRWVVLRSVENMKQADLDHLFDANANTIGALLLHLAATESFYQVHTFEGISWDKFPDDYKKKWEVPMNLGEPARKTIKGNDLSYYTDILSSVREKTLAEFRKRDDDWLMKVDPKFFADQPTNNYCKWFHVCEHESNHNGQIKWLAKRLPGAKPGGE
ncbi:MAG: hypothetical protein C5B59_05020 [Bacteroidetes bacterium]|nr:MAG: hypothetical protein C5B59_05020 [Bacteroidota bacterium]